MNEFGPKVPAKAPLRFKSHYEASRREFLRSAVLAGAGAMAASVLPLAGAAAEDTKARRIDMHYHIAPPSLIAELGAQQFANVSNWTLDQTLTDMERNGIAASICSVAPQADPFRDGSKAVRLTRECNEYFATVAADHPGRFGFFAATPLPNMDAALGEVEYALDTLRAEGVALFTSYGDKWLGDPAFEPFFEELNRRNAVAFTHPNSANCCRNLLPNIGDGTIEWGTDTTRAIANLLFNGTARRCPGVRFVFSHGGGTMPYLVERFTSAARSPKFASQFPAGFAAEAGKFYYDTAWTTNPEAMSALSKLVPISQILFGTDFPYRTAADQLKGLQECGVFSAADLDKIESKNALPLLPRFRAPNARIRRSSDSDLHFSATADSNSQSLAT